MAVPQTLNIDLQCDPERTHPQKTEMDSNKDLYIHVHISKKWKQPKYPSANE